MMAGVTVLFQSGIALIEMLFWMHPDVHWRLLFNAAEAEKAASIVRNAGLYNAFLAAGLIWGLRAGSGRTAILSFFSLAWRSRRLGWAHSQDDLSVSNDANHPDSARGSRIGCNLVAESVGPTSRLTDR